MKELNLKQMEWISGGDTASNWCAGVSVAITWIGPIVGISTVLMWTGACWWLG